MKQKIKEIWEKCLEQITTLVQKIPIFSDMEDSPINSVMDYKERLKRQRQIKLLKRAGVVVLVVAVIGIIKYSVDNWTYDGYEIVSGSMQEVTMSAKYTEFGENLLKYGGDEIALMNRQEEILWTSSETMDYPIVDVCEDACLVYDKKGTSFSVFDIKGKIGTIQTTLPILKANVAKQGVVAAILEDGDTTWVNMYDTEGEVIVTSKTQMATPGYPLDIALSSDGLLMAVSYVKVENSKISSYVVFYNFGNTGQNLVDNVVNTYSYGDKMIPDVEYLDDTWAVAFCEDGFYLYKGHQIPEEQVHVTVDSEIMSIFHNEDYIGLVVRNTESEEPYRLELYNLKGKQKFSVPLESLFDTVKIAHNEILLYNNTNFAVYSMKGVCRYQGAMQEGMLNSLFKVAGNRYVAVLDTGMETFKLVN